MKAHILLIKSIFLITCMLFVQINAAYSGPLICSELLSEEEVDEYLERVKYQERMLEQAVSLEKGVRALTVERPQTRVFAIGEQHGHPNQHLNTVKELKRNRLDIDTLFIEVSQRLNGLFAKFFHNQVDVEEVMRVIKSNYQWSVHITRELLLLTKSLGIQIVGVEKLSGVTVTIGSMLDLQDRNYFTSDVISSYFQYNIPEALYAEDYEKMEEGKFRTTAAIYIGGAGHLHYRGATFSSVSDLLKSTGIPVSKILSTSSTANGSDWDIGSLVNRDDVEVPRTTQVVSFLPKGETPVFMPELPIVDSDETYWTEYNLIILMP